ncbi:hypothetical protein SUGI_0549570 [Cryptomeria japonica]|nr:hypothetical protein SUGI_0549570 [Cryptomeria japonica]
MNPEVFLVAKNGDNKGIQKVDRRLLRGSTFEGNTVLHIIAREGHLELVKWILQNVKGLSGAHNADNNKPLHEAAKQGNAEIIRTLLDYNKSLATKWNQFGESALIIASEHGHVEAARYWVEATPVYIILWPRNDHQTCLHIAAYGGHLGIPLLQIYFGTLKYVTVENTVEMVEPI